MKKEYSFKGGVRGKFHRPNKVQKTLRFDPDVLVCAEQPVDADVRGVADGVENRVGFHGVHLLGGDEETAIVRAQQVFPRPHSDA